MRSTKEDSTLLIPYVDNDDDNDDDDSDDDDNDVDGNDENL